MPNDFRECRPKSFSDMCLGKTLHSRGVLQSSGVQFMDDPDAESGIPAQLPVSSLFLPSKDNKRIDIIGVCYISTLVSLLVLRIRSVCLHCENALSFIFLQTSKYVEEVEQFEP